MCLENYARLINQERNNNYIDINNSCRGMLHRSDVSEGWTIPFPSADRPTALRTQRFLYDKYKERPAQIQFYVTLKSVQYR